MDPLAAKVRGRRPANSPQKQPMVLEDEGAREGQERQEEQVLRIYKEEEGDWKESARKMVG